MRLLIPEDFSGIIPIKQRGNVIIEETTGYADLPNKRPNRLMSNKGDNVWKLYQEILREFYGDIPSQFDYGE